MAMETIWIRSSPAVFRAVIHCSTLPVPEWKAPCLTSQQTRNRVSILVSFMLGKIAKIPLLGNNLSHKGQASPMCLVLHKGLGRTPNFEHNLPREKPCSLWCPPQVWLIAFKNFILSTYRDSVSQLHTFLSLWVMTVYKCFVKSFEQEDSFLFLKK